MTASQLSTLAITTIDVDPGFNPRGSIDADTLQPLADSISRHGVLQPIVVAPFGERFILVAGERRFRAAGIAGLTEIPAVIRDVNGDAFNVAIVENLQREQLSPIEEARAFERAIAQGMTEPELAAAIGVSEQLVRDRVRLLDLPATVQEKVNSRELTLAAAKNLQTFAAVSPLVVEKAAELVTKEWDPWDDPLTARDLERDPAEVLERVIDELEDDDAAPFLASTTNRHVPFLEQKLPWPDTVDVAALQQKAKLLPEHEYTPQWARPRADAQQLNDEELDAANAYGCILLLPDRAGDQVAWITDPVWLADQLNRKLDQALEARAKRANGAKASKPATAEAAEKQQRDIDRKERQKEQAKQLAARERNLRLGRELAKNLTAPKITVDGMRAIAEVLLAYAGDDLGRAGFRFVDEASQTETRRKDGSLSKVAHLRTTTDCRNLVELFVDAAATGEEIYGALVQLIVATQYADANAAPKSDRFGELRGVRYSGRAKGLVAAIDNIAKAVLSDDVRRKARRR
jgi:ParB family chromosome partitioning protein